jgi:hypothetical protein
MPNRVGKKKAKFREEPPVAQLSQLSHAFSRDDAYLCIDGSTHPSSAVGVGQAKDEQCCRYSTRLLVYSYYTREQLYMVSLYGYTTTA